MTNRVIYHTGTAPVSYMAMRDERLSIQARGLLALLMTHSATWKFNRTDIIKKCACSEGKYDRMRKELVTYNYLKIVADHDPKTGHIVDYIWQINGNPQVDAVEEITETPKTEVQAKTTETLEIGGAENRGRGKQGCIRVTNSKELKLKEEEPPTPLKGGEPIICFDDVRLDPKVKIKFLDPWVPPKSLKDFARIELRLSSDEIKDALTLMAEYWRSKGGRQTGSKTPRGWNATIKTWFRKEAVALKAKWRDSVIDTRARSDKPVEDVSEITNEIWEFDVRIFKDEATWRGAGPKPDEPGCLAPAAILQSYGYSLTTES